MHSALEWDDLRYVLAVGRSGSLSGAARTLRVNHSTVFRRIGAIEQKLGVRLFDRRRDGYVPTAPGEAAVRMAEQLETDVVALERRLAGQDLRPSGTVRVTTTDTLIDVLVPLCADFRRLYPEITVDLVTGNEMLNLSRRDADIAVRPSMDPPESLHGRRIATIAFAPYASQQYLASVGGVGLERIHQWIGLDDLLSHLSTHRWLRENISADRIAFRSSAFLAARSAAVAGMGAAILPCYLADGVGGLVRIADPIPEVGTDLWLLVHDDLRRTARVRALLDFLAAELPKLRDCLEGRSGCVA
jgi:DNA-binding transcriptional LysR family regulator